MLGSDHRKKIALLSQEKVATFHLPGHQCNPSETGPGRIVYLRIIISQGDCSNFNLINPNVILFLHHDKSRKINWFYTNITEMKTYLLIAATI